MYVFVIATGALLASCAASPPATHPADALMRDLAQRNLFQGAVVMGRGSQIEYAAGFGWADVQRQVPFTPDTPTDGASIAKTFTAAAVLMLQAQGRIDLDTPVREILPTFPHPTTRVRHLLSHSAGLVGYEWLDARVTMRETRTNASHLALVARDAPVPMFTPGSAFAYDNVAYDLAAMAVERSTGAPYADVLAERFSRPLNLGLTLRPARFADWQGPRTRGYGRTDEGWKDNDAHDLEGFYGGANIYLSARDLYRWVSGYKAAIGPQAYRASITAAKLDDGRSTGLTLGSWYVSPDGTRRYYTGHHNGFFCFGYADDARGVAIAWVANDSPPSWLQPALSRALIAIAEGRVPPPLMALPGGDPMVDPTGRYRVAEVGDVALRRDGRQLGLLLRDVEYKSFAIGNGVHYVPGLDAYLRFVSGPSGQVSLSWDSVYLSAPVSAGRARTNE